MVSGIAADTRRGNAAWLNVIVALPETQGRGGASFGPWRKIAGTNQYVRLTTGQGSLTPQAPNLGSDNKRKIIGNFFPMLERFGRIIGLEG